MLKNPSDITKKQRHGCLTAYLIVFIIGTSVTLILGWLLGPSPENELTTWEIAVDSMFAVLAIVCAIAVFMWKKWGVWGLTAVLVAGCIANIIQGELVIVSIIDMILSLGLLYWVLNIGGENKGWPQMK